MTIIPEFDGTNGMAVALARIAQEAEAKTGVLDLSDLGLSALPEALRDVPHLRDLKCSSNAITRLDGLQNCADLQRLDCSGTQITSLDGLQNCTALKTLICSFTEITRLDGLQNCTALQSLYCYGTQITRLDGLQNCTALKTLNCSSTVITSLDGLQNCTALKTLICSFTEITRLDGLQNCTALQSLSCSGTQITSLDGLQNCTDLKNLTCHGTQITSLDGLQNCTDLKNLTCYGTQITSLDGLQNCTDLKNLTCFKTQITRLDGLQNCTDLQRLDCSDTQITSLDGLQNCTALQRLDCYGTQITRLDGLQNCTALQSLTCSRTPITSLDGLQNCTALQILHCFGTPLKTFPADFWTRPALLYVCITKLLGVPPEILSKGFDDNCLPLLRDYFADLGQNPVPVRDVKLFLLGNGGTGKTQMARHLRGEAFTSDWDSTHGIQVTTATLPSDGHQAETRLHLWDFGGQELYHSTHTLFLRSRAVFAVLWSADREPDNNILPNPAPLDYNARTYPLQYWLDHIADQAGADSPILLVQSKCDSHNDERPAPPTDGAPFAFLRRSQFGAQKSYRAGELRAALRDAVCHLHATEEVQVIGQAWQAVQRAIENLREADGTYRPENQWRDQAWFADLCAQHGVNGTPETLRTYLHRCGVIIYDPRIYKDRIIIDQAWALGAIYTLFERKKVYERLRAQYGRFTLADLSALVWHEEGFSPDEQRLFLSFMETCGICFVYQRTGAETIYLAPDLLPEQENVNEQLNRHWRNDGEVKSHIFNYPVLRSDILRAVICRIGKQAKMRAIYWRNGLYFYEETTLSHARIDLETNLGPHHSASTLRISVKGSDANRLLTWIILLVQQINSSLGLQSIPYHGLAIDEMSQINPGDVSDRYYISYAWRDNKPIEPEMINYIETFIYKANKKKINIRRDEIEMKLGDSITQFMDKLAQGKRIFIILSDAYLLSKYCTYELAMIWQNCGMNSDVFTNRVRIYLYKDIKIDEDEILNKYFNYWKNISEKREKDLENRGLNRIAPLDLTKYQTINTFVNQFWHIFSAIRDRVQPKGWDDFIKYALDDLTPSP